MLRHAAGGRLKGVADRDPNPCGDRLIAPPGRFEPPRFYGKQGRLVQQRMPARDRDLHLLDPPVRVDPDVQQNRALVSQLPRPPGVFRRWVFVVFGRRFLQNRCAWRLPGRSGRRGSGGKPAARGLGWQRAAVFRLGFVGGGSRRCEPLRHREGRLGRLGLRLRSGRGDGFYGLARPRGFPGSRLDRFRRGIPGDRRFGSGNPVGPVLRRALTGGIQGRGKTPRLGCSGGGRIQDDRHRFGRRVEKASGVSPVDIQAEHEKMKPGGKSGCRCETFHGGWPGSAWSETRLNPAARIRSRTSKRFW